MTPCGRIGLGTVQWGMPYGIANTTGQPASQEIGKLLDRARLRGVKLLDTAAAYGSAEILLGDWDVAAAGFKVVTKIIPSTHGVVKADEESQIAAALDQSLHRLKSGRVYGLMVHHAETLLGPDGARTWEALQTAKQKGLTEKVGVSVYTPGQLIEILDHFPIDIVQLPFNVYDQRFLRNGLLDRLAASGIEIHARSAFLQGLLLIPPSRLPIQFGSVREHHRRYFAALAAADLSPLAGALGFCLAQEQIDQVIVGCESLAQLDEILEVASQRGNDPEVLESFSIDDEAVINPSRWHQ